MSCLNFNATTNCSNPGYPVPFDGDPDIAGIGVILAFLLTAWATFLFVLITFFLVEEFDGMKNDMDVRVVTKTRKLKDLIRPLLPKFFKLDRPFSLKAIEDVAFTLSDQQLITGVSIFIVGFAEHSVITQYHFYVVYLLGVLSFATHQSTMMIVSQRLSKEHWKRWWRLATICLIFIFSFVSNIPLYNENFLAEYGLRMQCVWNDLSRPFPLTSLILLVLTSLFLIWGLFSVIVEISPEAGRSLGKIIALFGSAIYPILSVYSPKTFYLRYSLIRRKLKRLEHTSRTHQHFWWLLEKIIFLIFLFSFTVSNIISSRIVDLYRVWVTLFYTTYTVLNLRTQAKNAVTCDGTPALASSEDTWGFGQILPMLLLALPLTQVWEMVREDIEERRKLQKDNAEKPNPVPDPSSAINPQAESIPMGDTPLKYQASPWQEARDFDHFNSHGTRNSTVSDQQATGEFDVIESQAPAHEDRQENPNVPIEYQLEEEQAKNVWQMDTANLERAPGIAIPDGANWGPTPSANEVEAGMKELYDSTWIWVWLWFWIVIFFGATTFFATLGILF